MVVTHGKDRMVMKRHVDGARIRTDIDASGTDVQMIELGDAAGTTYMVMPKEKQVMKQSRTALMEQAKKLPAVRKQLEESESAAPTPESKVEYVGKETLEGRVLDKYKATYAEGTATAWLDPATKAPVRMESADATLEWKNFKAEPQSPALFEIPKGYQVMDMDEMMKQARDMKMPGGMGSMAGMAGMGGMGGMPGMGGGLNGMAGRAGENFGSQMGSNLGTTLGASFGGPLGAMAGGYLGGKIGGMIGRKAATAITPGN
jgi:hypothetical protein